MAIKIDFDLKDIDRGLKVLQTELLGLKDRRGFAKVGVLGKSSDRTPGPGEASAPLSNVDIAVAQEFGTETIPQRSFIRAAFDENQAKYVDHLRLLVRGVYDRKLTVSQALGLLGLEAASDIRNLIRAGSGIPPPNAPATIAAKGSSHTLIDTGQLAGAVSHEVVLGASKTQE